MCHGIIRCLDLFKIFNYEGECLMNIKINNKNYTVPQLGFKHMMSDGKLMETQTANYFSDIYPIDCAVLSANA